ncbi:MAG: biotin transporter BioY [Gammaproteobacteria bacterium]|nr:biotin transporter BioY [Gammaproteobacteria bacterium]
MFTSQASQNVLWSTKASLLKRLALIGVGVVLLAGAAQLAVPMHPVPLTFQSSMVVLLAMVLGLGLGTQAISIYLIAGFCGLPLFAEFMGGPAMLADPSVGYLFGFIPAALISGYLSQKGWGRNFISSYAAAALGVSALFACGYLWLAAFVGFHQAFELGVAPFLLAEPLKLIVVALLVPRFWKA